MQFWNGLMETALEWSLIARLAAGGAIGALVGGCLLAIAPLLWDAGRENPRSLVDVQASPVPSAGIRPSPQPEVHRRINGSVQGNLLLEQRDVLEMAAGGASGIAISIEFPNRESSPLVLKAGSSEYKIATSIAHATGGWVYPDQLSARKMYSAKWAKRGEPVDIRGLRIEQRGAILDIGEHVFIELDDGKQLQLVLVGARYHRGGDDKDELRFKYKIYERGEFLTTAL